MKVKKLKEGGFCFVVGFFLNIYFYHQKMVITYKLSTIKGFYHKRRNFATILVFLDFCHSLGEIIKEKKIGKRI